MTADLEWFICIAATKYHLEDMREIVKSYMDLQK